jgi:DNA-directed RNA polymerase subunit N (RpoN/RPB10)
MEAGESFVRYRTRTFETHELETWLQDLGVRR